MRILVLGASGGVGRHAVTRALAAGHEVRVLARDQTVLAVPDSVEIVRGELLEGEALGVAMRGVDAVVSSVGAQRRHPANPWSAQTTPDRLTSRAAERMVAAMREAGVRRVAAVSAGGVGDSAAALNLVLRVLLATTMIGEAYADLARMEAVFAESGVDWLAPRPTRLVDGDPTGAVRVVERFGAMDAIRRADVAAFLVDALAEPTWPHAAWGGRTPQISN